MTRGLKISLRDSAFDKFLKKITLYLYTSSVLRHKDAVISTHRNTHCHTSNTSLRSLFCDDYQSCSEVLLDIDYISLEFFVCFWAKEKIMKKLYEALTFLLHLKCCHANVVPLTVKGRGPSWRTESVWSSYPGNQGQGWVPRAKFSQWHREQRMHDKYVIILLTSSIGCRHFTGRTWNTLQ